MNDKQKIEEMAKVIKEVKYEPFNKGNPTYKVGNQMSDFVFDKIAEALLPLIKKYQEQAVKEFYKEAKENFDWYYSRHGSLDGEDCEKILTETLKEVIGEKE